ncbi:hypothetical protein L226DRAFT_558132 [Lentinus tigrinus ALCF2SS1-7]|uniref:Uncharacterized protein n=1 Tax=Lentinus tigrinus ALCF2SS1-6 TaxID=1328759 RepID=A0A5C2RT61_9APHY|nr:hypothetical protein L227DRAFT_604451 [Lentinus tigrinus ALCF2SS1-6]RPD79676.1 hypothetical protein L226DRAFT_558132 [Lentinus tigrinus ALCF2SS1-7]
MNASARVHVTQTLDVTQAEFLHDLAKFGKGALLEELYSRWYILGASAIDVVVRVGSLAFFTAIVIAAAHVLLTHRVARTEKDSLGFMLLSIITLWWASAAASAIAVLSKALQRYLRLGSNMIPIADLLDTVTHCAVSTKDCTYAFEYYKPAYTYAMHQCVGTAALATKQVLIEAVVCIFVWGMLKNSKFAKGCVITLFLATCASAAVHAKRSCFPEPVPAESRIPPWNVAEEELGIDNMTSNLFRTTLVVALFIFVQQTWQIRHEIKAAYQNGAAEASQAPRKPRPRAFLVFMMILGMVCALIRESFRDPVNLGEYALQSWTNGFLIPFLGICPCLELVAYHLRKTVPVDCDDRVSKEDGFRGKETA